MEPTTERSLPLPTVASREGWRAARLALLEREKQLTQARDALNAERRALPMVEVVHARETTLVLVSRASPEEIAPFRARVGWTVPWYSSLGSDFNYDFHATTDEAVAPVEYNYRDKRTLLQLGQSYHVQGEQPGASVFLRDGDRIFHTYSTYGRGLDALLPTSSFLDLTPFGRGEGWGGMPDVDGKGMNWLRHHDRYDRHDRHDA